MYHRRIFSGNNNNNFDGIVKISDEEFLEIKNLFKTHCREGSASVNVEELTSIWRDCVNINEYDPLEIVEGSRDVMNELNGGSNEELSFIEFMKVFKGKSVFINIAISNLREVVLSKVKQIINNKQNSPTAGPSSSPRLPHTSTLQVEGRDSSLFVKEVDVDLLCSICMCVLVNPFDSPCSHSFCYSCINSALRKKSECPDCRTPLTVPELKPTSFRFKSMLAKLQAYCDNKSEGEMDEGCEWKGEWGLLASHLQLECSYTIVDCSFNCGKSIQRLYLSKHQEICSYRPTSCEYCTRSLRVLDMEQHLQSCTEYPVLCKCGKTITRANFDHHEKEVCGETRVKCKFFQFGCTEVARKDLDEHIERSHAQHIVYLLSHIEENSRQMNSLKEEVQALQLELHTTQVALQTKESNQLKLVSDVSALQELVQGVITEQSKMNTSLQFLALSENSTKILPPPPSSESASNYFSFGPYPVPRPTSVEVRRSFSSRSPTTLFTPSKPTTSFPIKNNNNNNNNN